MKSADWKRNKRAGEAGGRVGDDMGTMVGATAKEMHPVSRETARFGMAKASLPHVPNREKLQESLVIEQGEVDQREKYGRLLRVVMHVIGCNRDEMAQRLGVDARQLGRWFSGAETAQMWRYHRDPVLRRTLRLVEALDDAEGAIVETTIKSKLDLGTEQVA